MTTSKSNQRRVVIVGGGFAGRRARRLLQSKFEVVLIDAKGYFEHTPSVLRCLVEPSHCKKVVLEHPEDVTVGTVVSVSADSVRLASGDVVRFDYCLLCTGSSYTHPIKPKHDVSGSVIERRQELESAHECLRQANQVVIVGGGTVGVELAAEIVGKWGTEKTVTLIASQERLLERMPVRASLHAAKWLESKAVKMILGERVVDWGSSLRPGSPVCLKTDQGRVVEGDLLYKTIGFAACSPPIDSGGETSGGSSRSTVVESTLQVPGMPNVFSAGDCTKTSEEKTAFSADLAAAVASENIIRLANGQKDLLEFPESICHGLVPEIVDVSLYKFNGILQFRWIIITGLLAAAAKFSIEMLQILLAKEYSAVVLLWSIIEALMVRFASWL